MSWRKTIKSADEEPAEPSKSSWRDSITTEPEKTGVLEAAGRGVAQGASLGFIDEASAGVGAAKDWASGKLGLRGEIDIDDAYDSYIDLIRAKDQKAEEDQGAAFTAGQVGGGIASAFVPGVGALNSAKAASAVGGTAAKALGGLGKAAVRKVGKEGVGRTALMAGQGGLAGAGTSEANPFDADEIGQFLSDVGTGAATGALTQGTLSAAAPTVTRAAKALPGKLKGLAERTAFKAATGNQGRAWDSAQRQGRVNEIGRDLLDDDIVTFGANARKIADKADTARKATGKQIGDLLGEVDEAVDGSEVANRILDYAASIESPANKSIVESLLSQAEDFQRMGKIPLKEANRLKGLYRFDDRNPSAMPIGKEATNTIRGIIGDQMEEAVGRYGARSRASSQVGEQFAESVNTGTGPAVTRSVPGRLQPVIKEAEAAVDDPLPPGKKLELYENLKRKYGSQAQGADNAEALANRQEKNRLFSLTDYVTGSIAGGAAMNPIAGVAVAGANKVIRERGASTAAVTLDKIGDVLKASPQAFGRYAPALQKAAERGGPALGVTHFLLLQQDPEYRKQVGLDEE